MQTEQPHLLTLLLVRGQISALAVEDESIDGIPALHHVEPLVDLAAEFLGVQIAAEKDGLDGPTQLAKCLVGGMLDVGSREAPQDALCVGHSELQGRRVFDHRVELLLDEFPVDRSGGHDQFEVRKALSSLGSAELLGVDGLETRHQLETQQATEGEGNLALAVAIDILPLDVHLGGTPTNVQPGLK